MKILHVAQKVKGGVATHLCELIPDQQARYGKDQVLVAVAADEIEHLASLPSSTLRLFRSSARSPGALAAMGREVARLIRREQPDIVHIHSTFAGLVVRLPLLLRRGERPRVVYCAHGWAFNMQVSQAKRRAYAAAERLLARVTDAILCISEFEERRAAEVGLPGDKLHMVYNGIAPDTPPVATATLPNFDTEHLNLLFVGRQDPQKGFDDLRHAMAQVADIPVHLHVVGDRSVSNGDSSAEPDPPNVTRYGWVAIDRIPAFLEACDVVMMPSRWEGFGLVAIEAMRQGKPVCASDADALPEIVVPGISGYIFPAGNVEALAELIRSMSRSQLQRLGVSARQHFRAKFTVEQMSNAISRLYEEVI
ncbi:glycosyltransferase family 4 protein [Sphingomonas desiccabilis]|uniref:Glycosyltransferase n=1 Tax=Sphingomonas desiccabilis TaxID=429134 RepID=A0A4Q2IVH5_9SPHN|nr:glycosyltransferase family 4 protein [Sphingomonas desiccabilis]MBB3910008.1 glycosyltransferase involved in cell wall biosynthesis [Sphingomonas desiccabilis]RXZ34709.1 glycosyltransferase [Sphingomonas desiccabilis]